MPELTWESTSDGSHFGSDSHLVQRSLQVVRRDLADTTWKAFWSSTVEGVDPAEVAERLGIAKSSVYQAKTRVRRRIREEFGGFLDGPS